MSECRVCLEIRKNTRSIFDKSEGSSSNTYADMITYVASLKITRNDGITDKICLGCRKKLRDLYEFKLLIQSSNASLYQKFNSHLKRIQFNDITEVKLEIDTSIDDKHRIKEYEDIKINLLNAEDSICYNNTTIKKLESNGLDDDLKEPMSVIDFLNTIKDDPDDAYDKDFDIGDYAEYPDSDQSDEYIPPYSKYRKFRKKVSKEKNTKCTKQDSKRNHNANSGWNHIKPVVLTDLRVLPTKCESQMPRIRKKKETKLKKESVCPYCGKLTRSIQSHLLVHGEAKFKCDQCGKGYYTQKALENHQMKHNSTKDFKCDQCVAAFNNPQSLKHHKVSHLDIRKFVCEICKKSYKRKHQLIRHVRTHNSANKSHKCELCNMSFFSVYGLRHHMRVHTGERPFNCELCSQPYSYKHDFNRHCFKKHGIFLKRRRVYVMNEEVLARERLIMKDLMLKANGIVKEGEPLIPFDEPNAAQAFEQAMKTFRNNPLNFNLQT